MSTTHSPAWAHPSRYRPSAQAGPQHVYSHRTRNPPPPVRIAGEDAVAGDGDGTNRADAAQQAHVQDQAGACRTSWPPCLWPSLPSLPSIPFAVLVLSVPVQMIGPGRSLPAHGMGPLLCLCSRRRHIPVPLFSEAPAAGTLFVLSDRGGGKPLEMQRVARAPSEIDRGGKRGPSGLFGWDPSDMPAAHHGD